MLKHIRNIVNEYDIQLVYYSLVLSHLYYCDIVWGECASIHVVVCARRGGGVRLQTGSKRASQFILAI